MLFNCPTSQHFFPDQELHKIQAETLILTEKLTNWRSVEGRTDETKICIKLTL